MAKKTRSGTLRKDPETILAITSSYPEIEDLKAHTIEDKAAVCFGVDLQGELGTICAGIKKASKGYSFKLVDYPFYRIVYTFSGRAKINDGKQTFVADAGSTYYFAPKESGTVTNEFDLPWGHIYVHFTGTDAKKMVKKITTGSDRVIHVSDPGEIQQLFENIAFSCIEQNEDSQVVCDCLLRVLLIKLAHQVSNNRVHPSVSHIRYIECRSYINDHFSDIISIDAIAENCCINKIYLCRLFKKYADIGPMAYVMKLKLNKAALLLIQTDYSVKQISLMLHFDNQYYFSWAFKHMYGISPKHYREQH